MSVSQVLDIHRSADLDGVAHGFFGRGGGVSTGLYESLNCGPGSRDAPEAVRENRARAAAALAPGARLVTLSQIHSPFAHIVGPQWDMQTQLQGDGLATDRPGVMLGILTADCAPVLFADAEARVIGAAHAGWKGALGGVLDATLAAMEALGARRSAIAAAIGPCISQANYEVGPEFRARFEETDFFTAGQTQGHFHFDLEGYAAHRLAAAGVAKVARMGLCTYPPENGFFSFRRTTHRGEADYGREISAIVIPQ
jgi:YfiH family protein